MAEKEVKTHEGTVAVAKPEAPTEGSPAPEVAYSSPYMEKLAKEQAEALAAAADPKESFRGPDWSGLPNFYCPLCGYASLDGDAAVLNHGAMQHPGIDLGLIKEAVVEEQPAEEEEVKKDG